MAKLFLTPIDLNQNELKKAVIENYPGNPNGAVTGVEGQILYDSTNNVLYVCTSSPSGTVWASAGADTNTTYAQSAVTTTGGALLRLTAGGSGSGTDDVKFASGTGITVAQTDADTITITNTATDTNTTYDISAASSTGGALIRLTAGGSGSGTDDVKLANGTGITATYTNPNTITIASTIVNTDTTYSVSAETNVAGAAIRLTAGGSGSGTDDVIIAAGMNIDITRINANTIMIENLMTDTNWYPDTFAWTAGTTAGPTGTLSGTGMTDVSFGAIPAAGTSASGVVTTGAQSFSGDKTFNNNVVVTGNLTVNGTTTTINTATIVVSDNIFVLNGDVTGTPTENAGIEVERGTSSNVAILWDETADNWVATKDGTNYLGIARKFATTLASVATSHVIPHTLGTSDVVVMVRQVASPYAEVICDVEITSADSVTVKFATAPAANTYRVIVVG